MIKFINKIHAAFGLLLLLAFTLLPMASLKAALPDAIHVSVTPSSDKYGPEQSIMLDVAYTNTGQESVKVLRWDTVLDGRIDVDFLDLELDGFKLPYAGRIYKRARPTPQDYIDMMPGVTYRETVDIATGYEVNFKGQYTLSIKDGHHSLASSDSDDVSAKFKSTSFKLTDDRPIKFKQTPSFDSSCVPSRHAEIDLAVANAEIYARVSRDDLRNTPVAQRPNAARYAEWFGSYTAARWDIVQSHFDKIYAALNAQVLNFKCDDTESAFAFVYVGDHYTITLGQAFWSAPRTGTDSKAGTLIHELSHFTVVAGTDDHVYGQSAAKALALRGPRPEIDNHDPIENADNHEYFAENTPPLSMPAPSPVDEDDDEGENEDDQSESSTGIIAPILPILLDE